MEGAGPDPAGRVQVFARVRPASGQEDGLAPAVEVDDGHRSIRVRNNADAVERILGGLAPEAALGAVEAREFAFDAVFPERASQREVFQKVGLPVLKECLKGINGAILAYGQTGSGKTHSLLHQGQKGEDAGLLPRLVASLFLQIAQDSAHVYTVEAAALQVYNEQIDDLLHPEHQSGGGQNLGVRDGGAVPGLTWLACKRPEMMIDAFNRARANVVYAETKMNKASSRSHAVFQVRITKRARATAADGSGPAQRMECTHARLLVVDLAGSERVKKSGAEGMRFQEATAINKSLLAFGNVVSALAAKKAHVPLRDSKLTRILDGSIGGNCKTALLVCASPSSDHVSETINTFEFASRAMRVEVDAKVNTITVEVSAQALLADLTSDAEHLGGLAVAPELEALRRKSAEAAERAKQEALQREQAAAEAEREARKLQRLAESAEQEGRKWKQEVEGLRQSQELARGEADRLRRSVDEAQRAAAESRAAAEARAADAERLKAALQAAEQAAAAAAKEAAEAAAARAEAARREAAEAAKRREEVARLREEASAANEQLGGRAREAAASAAQAEGRAQEALERAERAERERDELLERVATAEAAQEAAQVKAAEEAAAREEEAAALGAQRGELLERSAALEADVSAHLAALREREGQLDEARAALERLRADSESTLAALRARHDAEVGALTERMAAEAARWAEERSALEAAHSQALEAAEAAHSEALEAQRQSYEERLAAGAREHEERVAELEQAAEAGLEEMRRRLEGERASFEERLAAGARDFEERLAQAEAASKAALDEVQRRLEEEQAKWKEAKEEAVREAWEVGSAQQRRLAAAFKAARCLTQAKEAELREAHSELAKRFAARESREDDVAEIERQRRKLDEQLRALRRREGEVRGLSLELQNRDQTDRIFSEAELRHRPHERRGIVPALPGRKVGDTRCFAERELTRHRRGCRPGSADPRVSFSASVPSGGLAPVSVR